VVESVTQSWASKLPFQNNGKATLVQTHHVISAQIHAAQITVNRGYSHLIALNRT
jgi:hypothetical protein